jgi:hypothetical protein
VKGWLLDTNVIAEVSGAKPDLQVRKWISRQDESTLYLSVLTLAEYEKGIHHLPEADSRRLKPRASVAALEVRFQFPAKYFCGQTHSFSENELHALRKASCFVSGARLPGIFPTTRKARHFLADTTVDWSRFRTLCPFGDLAHPEQPCRLEQTLE